MSYASLAAENKDTAPQKEQRDYFKPGNYLYRIDSASEFETHKDNQKNPSASAFKIAGEIVAQIGGQITDEAGVPLERNGDTPALVMVHNKKNERGAFFFLKDVSRTVAQLTGLTPEQVTGDLIAEVTVGRILEGQVFHLRVKRASWSKTATECIFSAPTGEQLKLLSQ